MMRGLRSSGQRRAVEVIGQAVEVFSRLLEKRTFDGIDFSGD